MSAEAGPRLRGADRPFIPVVTRTQCVPERLLRISPPWLAVSLMLTSMTELRVAPLPIGPGEALLLAWMVVHASYLIVERLQPVTDRVTYYVTGFWYLALLFIVLGWSWAYVAQEHPDGAYHDFSAMVFSGAFSFVLVLVIRDSKMVFSALFWLVLAALIPMIAGFATYGFDLEPFLETGTRFRGLADNPNQLGLFLAPLPFTAFFLVRRVSSTRASIALFAVTPLLVAFGFLTKSDALMLGWILGGLFLAVFSLPIIPASAPLLPRFVLKGIVFLLLGLVVLLVIEPWLGEVYSTREQGSERLSLWQNGFQAAVRSPLFGWGPGPHSGVAAPLAGQESHNTLIDLVSAGGLVLGILAVLLGLRILYELFRHHSWTLLSATVVVLGFALFHNSLRQPLFWFYLFSGWLYVARGGDALVRSASTNWRPWSPPSTEIPPD